MGQAGTTQEESVRPAADALEPPERCPACTSTQTQAVTDDAATPLYNRCDGCGHRWHRWPMSGRWEHLRKAAQIELKALE